MNEIAVHERLRQARERRGESRTALARRTGVGERLLQAIDEGRLGDLPGGLYARMAVRRYASAVGFDPEATLAACAERLPGAEDPVAGLARLQGLRPALPISVRSQPAAPPSRAPQAEAGGAYPSWRPLAALAVDSLVIAGLLVVAIAATVPLSGALPSGFGGGAAPVFGLLGLVLAACYFLCFGGIACATAGERLIGMRSGRRQPRRMGPRLAMGRALRCWGRDVRYLLRLGTWAGAALGTESSGPGAQARPMEHAAGR